MKLLDASGEDGSERAASPVDWRSKMLVDACRAVAGFSAGLSIVVLSPGANGALNVGLRGLCALSCGKVAGCVVCRPTRERLRHDAAAGAGAQRVECGAGLSAFVKRVMHGAQHVAILGAGPVFDREPTQADFEQTVAPIRGELDSAGMRRAREAYFAMPRMPAHIIEGLLDALAFYLDRRVERDGRRFLGDFKADGQAPAPLPSASPLVARAKQIIGEDLSDITAPDVVGRLRVSQGHLCRAFKKETGLTLTDYIAGARVAKACELLGNPACRVTDIAFAVGFGSVPRFNAVFKRETGMSPTEYRKSQTA